MYKQDFYKAVANVITKMAAEANHRFAGPFGESQTPYDVLAFKGWKELAEELKLEDNPIQYCKECGQVKHD